MQQTQKPYRDSIKHTQTCKQIQKPTEIQSNTHKHARIIHAITHKYTQTLFNQIHTNTKDPETHTRPNTNIVQPNIQTRPKHTQIHTNTHSPKHKYTQTPKHHTRPLLVASTTEHHKANQRNSQQYHWTNFTSNPKHSQTQNKEQQYQFLKPHSRPTEDNEEQNGEQSIISQSELWKEWETNISTNLDIKTHKSSSNHS